ncbi:MAG: serine protease Do [Colwellia sp.]|jgi:serine protease Do
MKKVRISIIAIIVLLVLLFFVIPVQSQDNGMESLRQSSKAFASVARSVSPSVVFIQVEATKRYSSYHQFPMPFDEQWPFGSDFFKRFFDDNFGDNKKSQKPRKQPKVVGQGSGFIFASKERLFVDKSYILTNNHVVENAEKINVILQDGREFEADIVGTDPKSDVAILEIKTGKLPMLNLGDSSKLEVGEWVVAIGNPFGLSHTLTVGVVSATGRNSLGINDYEDFIQTDAAINPGNSGGPLVNLDGDVVGINTAIFSKSGGYMGIGFAIPINLANDIAQQLMKYGEVTRGYLGVLVQELSPELAKSFDLEKNEGVLVAQVMDDSAATEAGIKQGDIIISFRDKPILSIASFRNLVALTSPESEVLLKVIRDGKPVKVTVIIKKLTQEKEQTLSHDRQSEELGLTVQNITPNLAEKFGVKSGQGVLITEVKTGSVADMENIKVGSVILQVNRVNIKNTNDFNRELKQSSKDKLVLLLIKTDNKQYYIVLSWS